MPGKFSIKRIKKVGKSLRGLGQTQTSGKENPFSLGGASPSVYQYRAPKRRKRRRSKLKKRR